MKKWLLAVPVVFLFACGGEAPVEELKLEKFEDKLSYVLGAMSGRDLVTNPQIEGDRLTKELVIAGFKSNFMGTPTDDCKAALEGLLGMNGTDFNTDFLEEGSTCIGRVISYSLYSELQGLDKVGQIDTAILFKGFADGVNGMDTTVMSLQDQMAVNDEFSKSIQAMIEQEMETKWGPNRIAGEQFLAENKNKPGVITTPSGLQYEVMKPGSGESPGPQNRVRVHYHGTLLDGRVFDSSVERGESIEFGVTQVIPGWTEVLQLMKRGSKFKVYVPQELAYGAYPQPGGVIEPYSLLVFEIELLDF